MKILVCAKQVPEVSNVEVNPETGTLNRDGVASILNPFCEYAMDLALELRESYEGEVEIVVLSMGPPQARMALLRCLEMGADSAILVTDRKFAGADTWATALTIGKIVEKLEGVDLVLVGKHAVDGDTAQVGPMLAEILNIPQITYAVGLEMDPKGKRIRVRRENEGGYERVQMRLPGLVSVTNGAASRKVCSFQEILDAREKPITTMTAADLDLDEAELGLQGSLTQVVKVFPPTVKEPGRMLSGMEADSIAKEVVGILHEKQFV
jgi:electron transfer flavoprotein alpha/beta subunit